MLIVLNTVNFIYDKKPINSWKRKKEFVNYRNTLTDRLRTEIFVYNLSLLVTKKSFKLQGKVWSRSRSKVMALAPFSSPSADSATPVTLQLILWIPVGNLLSKEQAIFVGVLVLLCPNFFFFRGAFVPRDIIKTFQFLFFARTPKISLSPNTGKVPVPWAK